ncbi:unnamed protein product [Rotaria socialis]|uniref:Uncharacterized protein n=2 Tax=Rotaria socialis TaxID=392032 RepID=A0A818ADX7_9BILA|nr:unnamed protein product [Rotaria socialis]CAF4579990.1 unnamed protein product [Rotaria socialis]
MGFMASKEQLMTAAIGHQDIEAMKLLIKELTVEQMNAMCKYRIPDNENQCTILHYAAWQNNPDILALLLKFADVLELRDNLGWTPLMTAVNRDSKENVKMLLESGSKIDCDNAQGADLIAMAMNFNDIDLIEILMDHGAQVTHVPDTKADATSSMGCYLLHFAVDSGLIDAAQLLIAKGKIPIDTLDQAGWSPLHLAAGHNYLDIVKLLLENDADVNIRDSYENTPLAWAKEMNAAEVISELNKHGAIADKLWHGEKPKLHDFNGETTVDQQIQGVENSQFQMDEPKSESRTTDKRFLILDGLQRQR